LPELITVTGSADAVVTLADFTGPSLGVRLSVGAFGGRPHGRPGLAVAAALFEEGRFRVPVQAVFPPAELDRAAAGPRQGKIVVTVP
jgi:NADPH:quinone reductase-like Zn-dependent oxidoreductase